MLAACWPHAGRISAALAELAAILARLVCAVLARAGRARAAKLYSLLCQSLTRYGTFVLLCAFLAVLFWPCYTVLL